MSSPDASGLRGTIELKHFTHEHLLYYYGNADVDGDVPCALCGPNNRNENGNGMFSCKTCKFFVHKSCAEAPRYARSSLHLMHPLELFLPKNYPKCRICTYSISSYGYKCRSSTTTVCDFNLHIECATKSIFDPKDHQHSFIEFKPTIFTCDACGIDEDSKCFSCICSICQLQVHPTCRKKFPLSGRVRQRLHAHELKLCYSFQIDFDFSNKSCKICTKKMNNVLCLYQCNNNGCAYIAHASCATFSGNLQSSEYGYHNSVLEKVERKDIGTEQEQVIRHFSHPHSLIFSNIEPAYDAAICYGCVRPISAPFYACGSEKCNFFLHKQCSQLPKIIQTPLHTDLLELKDYLDFKVRDVFFHGFTCQACQVQCNGFAYECRMFNCGEIFDVGCTLFGDTLNHASHKCTLTFLSTIPNEENRCIACDSTFSNAFWCEECNFFLDLKCASMPKTIGHDCPTGTVWTVKPLKLTYDCIDHVGGQYYCHSCEETRGKDLWFYYCEDCRESIHPQCALGDDRFKYGKSYNIDGHCHTVCVAKKPKNDPLCDTCGEACQHSPLAFCPTCKVYFHDDLECCGMSSSMHNSIRSYSCGISSSPNDNEDDDEGEDEEEDEDKDEAEEEEQVNHFSHLHDLIMGEYDRNILLEEVCDGCGMQITVPFYRCGDKKGKCNFFLHKKCFDLPKQIQHPLHPDHPLVLNSFLDLPCNGEVGFICYGCNVCFNGFVYTCLACKFFLDVGCSLLSDTLVHKSHSCTLTLIDKKIEMAKGERKCQACNSDCSSCRYICDVCNFELGLRCASLPKVIAHGCSMYGRDILPQHLMYVAAIEYASGKYNCDRCYKPGSKKEWYYHCKDCGSSTHACCPNTVKRGLIKSGIEYKAYNHFHNLITVTIKNTMFHDCVVCKERMKVSPAVYCETCRAYFHVKCCRWLQRV